MNNKKNVNVLDCGYCGYEWEMQHEEEAHCPLCRHRLSDRVSPVNVRGDIWRPANPPENPVHKKIAKKA